MADSVGTQKDSLENCKTQEDAKKIQAALKREADEARKLRRAKRLEQHKHWMRVMMEGQATPDLRYQKT